MRVFGHRGVAVFPQVVRDKEDIQPRTTKRVMYLSPVTESAGGVWVLTEDGNVRDVLDRDVKWAASFVYTKGPADGDRALQELLEVHLGLVHRPLLELDAPVAIDIEAAELRDERLNVVAIDHFQLDAHANDGQKTFTVRLWRDVPVTDSSNGHSTPIKGC